MIDRDICKARALLVEGNPLLRSVTAGQLRNIGIGHVSTAQKPKEARLFIEREAFDIIVCNREFEGAESGGQDLLDELRRENQLPHTTVFIMVTCEAQYHHVVEAAEASLDGILVSPYTAGALADRLSEARARKRELAEVLRALDTGRLDQAMAFAQRRWMENKPYATYCGRLVAELMLRLGQFDEAIERFEILGEAARSKNRKAPPPSWAQIGRARGHMARGDNGAARRLLNEVLQHEPHNADAHDLMGRLQVEQCDLDGALASYQRSSELTPGCVLRAQHTGALAFYQDQPELSLRMLERSVGLGLQSKLFDALTLTMIAMLRFDKGDVQGVMSSLSQLGRYRERFPTSQRLERLERANRILCAWGSSDPDPGMRELREMSDGAGQDRFDLEAANLMLGLWARAPRDRFEPTELETVVDRIGMRFCTSKAVAEVLAASAKRQDDVMAVLHRCQARITATAERAMDHALRGDPAGAVRQLLQAGEQSLNAKLLEMTVLMARRHAASVPDAEASATRATVLLKRSCSSMTHIAGIQRTARTPGGLQLRGKAAKLAAAPTVVPTVTSPPSAAAADAAPDTAPDTAPGAAPGPGAAAQAEPAAPQHSLTPDLPLPAAA